MPLESSPRMTPFFRSTPVPGMWVPAGDHIEQVAVLDLAHHHANLAGADLQAHDVFLLLRH